MEVSDGFSAFIFMGRVFEWAYVLLSFICWSGADSLCDLPTFEINTSEVQFVNLKKEEEEEGKNKNKRSSSSSNTGVNNNKNNFDCAQLLPGLLFSKILLQRMLQTISKLSSGSVR